MFGYVWLSLFRLSYARLDYARLRDLRETGDFGDVGAFGEWEPLIGDFCDLCH